MACGGVLIAILAFLASALLLLSSVASSQSSPSPLIEDVCRSTGTIDLKKCFETLGSEPRVVAAKDLVTMLIALLETGISNGNKTRSYVQKMLKQPGLKPDYLYALQQCDSAYNNFFLSFRSALAESKEKDYDTASYDIKIAFTDDIDQCRNALTSKNVQDFEISKGNDFIAVFGAVAFNTANRLPSEDQLS